MQTLEHDDMKEEYPVPDDMDGVGVVIEEDLEGSRVAIKFGEHVLHVTVDGARDLALALRKAANKIEKHHRERYWIK